MHLFKLCSVNLWSEIGCVRDVCLFNFSMEHGLLFTQFSLNVIISIILFIYISDYFLTTACGNWNYIVIFRGFISL